MPLLLHHPTARPTPAHPSPSPPHRHPPLLPQHRTPASPPTPPTSPHQLDRRVHSGATHPLSVRRSGQAPTPGWGHASRTDLEGSRAPTPPPPAAAPPTTPPHPTPCAPQASTDHPPSSPPAPAPPATALPKHPDPTVTHLQVPLRGPCGRRSAGSRAVDHQSARARRASVYRPRPPRCPDQPATFRGRRPNCHGRLHPLDAGSAGRRLRLVVLGPMTQDSTADPVRNTSQRQQPELASRSDQSRDSSRSSDRVSGRSRWSDPMPALRRPTRPATLTARADRAQRARRRGRAPRRAERAMRRPGGHRRPAL